MSRRLSDRELDRLLAGLPREPASAGFSPRVLAGLDDPPRRRGRRGWLLAAGAAATAAALAVALWLPRAAAPGATAAETLALEREHRLLMEELESLKASLRASEPAPVLYLGGTESVDLVLDLEPVWPATSPPGVRPAALAAGKPIAAARGAKGDPR